MLFLCVQQWHKSTFINFFFLSFICVFLQSLGILASIPAAILIISLVGLLLYLLTRCCDRETSKVQSQSCQKFTLISTTLFCCAAIGLGNWINYISRAISCTFFLFHHFSRLHSLNICFKYRIVLMTHFEYTYN